MRNIDLIVILRAQQGDRGALDALLQRCQADLFRYLAGVLDDPSAAEDALQETLFRIARKLRWLNEPRYFRAWAFRIASREAYRLIGRRRFTASLDDVDPAALSVEPIDLPPRDHEGLRSAVAKLSPGSRVVIVLHYFEDLPLDEVADVLEIPLGTAKSRLAYGLAQLRRTAGEWR